MKIKPCPFCGRKPRWHAQLRVWGEWQCRNPKCYLFGMTGNYGTKAYMTAAWNTRAAK